MMGDSGRRMRRMEIPRRQVLRWSVLAGASMGVLRPGVAAAWAAPSAAQTVSVWLVDESEKVLRDQELPPGQPGLVSLRAARNESESVQLILRGVQESARVTVRVDGLPADSVRLYEQYYIDVTQPENQKFKAGWYPDALVPIANGGSVGVGSDQNSAVWLRISVPGNQPAGTYTGSITLMAGDYRVTIPLTLAVRDFDIGIGSSVPSAFAIWYDQMAWAHKVTEGTPEYWALADRYYRLQLDYRLPADDLPVPSDDPDTYVELAEPYLSDPRVTSFRIPYYQTSATSMDTAKIARVVGLLRKRGWLDKGYFYLGGLIDEPTADKYPLVQKLSEELAKIAPGVPHVVTTAPVAALADDVHVWAFPVSYFNPVIVQWIRNRGDTAWWYPEVGVHYPMPSVFVDDSALGTRLMSWMQHDFGITGFLYWATTIFEKYNGTEYVPRDDWTDPSAFPGTNGDGFLLYPGTRVGIDGPVATIRLDAVRKGLEDAEYLRLYEERSGRVARILGVQDEFTGRMALRTYYDAMYTRLADYVDDPARMLRVREQIGLEVETLLAAPHVVALFDDVSAGSAAVTVYAQRGSRVQVASQPAASTGVVGQADRYQVVLDLPAGEHQVVFRVDNAAATKEFTRTVVVPPPVPPTHPVPVNSFETDADVARLHLNHITAARSAEHATGGSYSAQLTYQADVDFPGFYFDAASDVGTSDWSGYDAFVFDLYNPSSDLVQVHAKYHQIGGASDDTHIVYLAAGENTVTLRLDDASIDLTQVAGLEVWSFKLTAPMLLYLDTVRFVAPGAAT